MRLVNRFSVLAVACMLPLAACGGSDGDDGGTDCSTVERTTYTYVVDTAQLPANPAQATELALDLDGADPIRNDNTLGMVLATLASQAGLDVTTAVGDAINNGDVILLASLETDDLVNSACARMGVYLGANPSTEPCADPNDMVCGNHLDGATSFELSGSSPTDTKIDAQILGGQYSLGPNHSPGNFTIEIDIAELGTPLSLNLVGARVQVGSVSADGLMSGLIGGAITEDDLQTSILPAIAGVVDDAVAADCTPGNDPCCTPGSAGATIIDLFDTDASCTITLEEIQTNDLIAALLAPDVDLLDDTGAFNPGVDGVNESLSIGLGFTAVGGDFTVP